MKVKDLIKELQKFDPELPVISRHSSRGAFAYGDVVVRDGKHSATKGKVCVEGSY